MSEVIDSKERHKQPLARHSEGVGAQGGAVQRSSTAMASGTSLRCLQPLAGLQARSPEQPPRHSGEQEPVLLLWHAVWTIPTVFKYLPQLLTPQYECLVG
jgi:hypothetical protein